MHAVTPWDPEYFSTLIASERDSIPAGATQLVRAPKSDRPAAGAVQPSIVSASPGGDGCTAEFLSRGGAA